MKRFILLAVCVLLASTASFAQNGQMAVGANITYGFDSNQLGAGPRFQYSLDDHWRGEASFNYFFEKNYTTAWDLNANIHYLIPLAYDWTIYPLAGLTYYHWSTDIDNSLDATLRNNNLSVSNGKLGMNIGCGVEYPITNSFKATTECKYQYVNKHDQLVVSFGLIWLL